ncbi:hypothetical protein Ddc_06541 [Ditylenchus destructor]|nr:hypothetical protein Ddc_06541 [Ditylenchus destructor]
MSHHSILLRIAFVITLLQGISYVKSQIHPFYAPIPVNSNNAGSYPMGGGPSNFPYGGGNFGGSQFPTLMPYGGGYGQGLSPYQGGSSISSLSSQQQGLTKNNFRLGQSQFGYRGGSSPFSPGSPFGGGMSPHGAFYGSGSTFPYPGIRRNVFRARSHIRTTRSVIHQKRVYRQAPAVPVPIHAEDDAADGYSPEFSISLPLMTFAVPEPEALDEAEYDDDHSGEQEHKVARSPQRKDPKSNAAKGCNIMKNPEEESYFLALLLKCT